MSEENVEVVRQGYAAWNKGNMDAMLALLDPDVEFMTSGTFLGLDPVYYGHDGFRKFWSDFPGIWESILISVDELRTVANVSSPLSRSRLGGAMAWRWAARWGRSGQSATA